MAATDQRRGGGEEDGAQDFRPVPVPQNQVAEIAARTGLPVEQVNPFVMLYAGNPYVLKAGLQFKADQRYGVGKYYVVTRFPSPVEYEMALRMMCWPKDEPIAMMITDFYLADKPERALYSNIGTASRKNCSVIKGVNNFDKRGLEIATTRSQNRTLRQATNCGFSPADDVYDEDEGATAPAHIPEKGGGPYGGFLKRCGELKADLKKRGQEKAYYDVLSEHSVRHANEVPPADLDRQMDILVALRGLGATPKAARERTETMFGREAEDATFTEPKPAQESSGGTALPSDPAPAPLAQPAPGNGHGAATATQPTTGPTIGKEGEKALYAWASANQLARPHIFNAATKHFSVTSLAALTQRQADDLKKYLIDPNFAIGAQAAPAPSGDDPDAQAIEAARSLEDEIGFGADVAEGIAVMVRHSVFVGAEAVANSIRDAGSDRTEQIEVARTMRNMLIGEQAEAAA